MNSVKRRGSGPSNRGGGARGRGARGGRGRGGTGAPPSVASPAASASASASGSARLGRKGYGQVTDDDLCDYLDVSDEFDTDGEGDIESSGPPGQVQPVPAKRKVEMQVLRMNEKTETQILKALHELYGGQYQMKGPEQYANLGAPLDRRFWVRETRLRVTGLEVNRASDAAHSDLNPYAVQRLESYGFHSTRLISVLRDTDGDVGRALERLLSQCFPGAASRLNPPSPEDLTLYREQKEDEKMALASIYHEGFIEKIPDKLWVIELKLPFMTKFLPSVKKSGDKKGSKAEQLKNACPFFMRGHCKFGRRCNKAHIHPEKTVNVDERHLQKDPGQNISRLEIRFHDQCQYPHDSPMVCFSNDLNEFPKAACLNITQRLMEEAQNLAQDHVPSVFSLVSLVEAEDVIQEIMDMPSHPFSFNPDLLEDEEGPTSSIPLPRAGEEDSAASLLASLNLKSGKSMPAPDLEKLRQDNSKIRQFCSKNVVSQDITLIRENLPAWAEKEHILKTLNAHQVLVISGMTGCGKSTQVPQYILDEWLGSGSKKHCQIICTQPRRISAIGVAERVAFERGEKVGNVVGYQIRLESKTSWRTRLLFCTTGILLRRLESDPDLESVTHIVVDEVHERSEESDFLLMILRGILKRRKDLKVLLMSATVNADLFSTYFKKVPVIDIPGRTFPVEQIFLEKLLSVTRFAMEEDSPYARPIDNGQSGCRVLSKQQFKGSNMKGFDVDDFEIEKYMSGNGDRVFKPPKDNLRDEQLNPKQINYRYSEYPQSVQRTLGIMDFHKINYDLIESTLVYIVNGANDYPRTGSILVFLPGIQEIMSLYDQIANHPTLGTKARKFKLIPLHSSLSSEEQAEVFKKPPEGVRKIVISTNLAETSITIDDCVFVIEVGRMKEKFFDSMKNMESLDTVWVSRANALQRKGRAGRVMPGYCFHLYTHFRFAHHLRQDPVPEIQRVPLEQMVLRIKILPLFKNNPLMHVLNAMIEPPENQNIEGAVDRLKGVGALDRECELTPLGFHLANLPVDVRIGKLMLFGSIFRCLDAALTIAACLSNRSPFLSPFGKRDEAKKKKLKFAIVNSDHLTTLRAYQEWHGITQKSQVAGYNFSQENLLSQKTLQMIATMKHQFLEILSGTGFAPEGISMRQLSRMSRNGSDAVYKATGEEFNENGTNWKLLVSVICAALYPNIVQVLSPDLKYKQTAAGALPKDHLVQDLKFKTKSDGYVNIHPSSINFDCASYKSSYLVYHEKVKTSRVFIRELSMIPVFPMILFGGTGVEVQKQKDQFLLSLEDGWIKFATHTHKAAELLKELRLELDRVMAEKIANPKLNLMKYARGKLVIDTIAFIISQE
ncbi:putative ATP-dependent RNA helicase DHX57 [Tigriopus californicus]|uniref:putative ATP-dependent RNA helicase DHX57 n=1 Tax=Tigriopus californicus TaxID=6832 RepID=UPI0027DA673E|nr:putative ATP-dependent RNA helicase DHX57 [Tigriopus californicus]